MIVLILAIIIGIGLSLFSTQNIHGVTITLANYPLTGVPLYAIVIVSFLVGILLSFIISIFSSLSSFFTLHKKDSTIHQAQIRMRSLEEKVRALEIENERLRSNRPIADIVEEEHIQTHPHPFSFLQRLRGNY